MKKQGWYPCLSYTVFVTCTNLVFREDYERDALQRISKRAHEELVADIRSSSLSPERGTSE